MVHKTLTFATCLYPRVSARPTSSRRPLSGLLSPSSREAISIVLTRRGEGDGEGRETVRGDGGGEEEEKRRGQEREGRRRGEVRQ